MPLPIDLTGRVFGRLTVLSLYTGQRPGNTPGRWWSCRCKCGTEKVVPAAWLCTKVNPLRSCGCLRQEMYAAQFQDVTGQRFGRLVAIEPTGHKHRRQTEWRCQCDCGREAIVTIDRINAGTRSCGCLKRKEVQS